MVAVTTTMRCGIRRTDKMAKENFQLHYARISKMMFLLNGCKYDHGSKTFYSTGFTPLEFDGFKCGAPFTKVKYVFKRAHLCLSDIRGLFNDAKSDICIDARTGKFSNQYSRELAQEVFGENVNESDVVYHIEKALKILLNKYMAEIKETLTEVAFF